MNTIHGVTQDWEVDDPPVFTKDGNGIRVSGWPQRIAITHQFINFCDFVTRDRDDLTFDVSGSRATYRIVDVEAGRSYVYIAERVK